MLLDECFYRISSVHRVKRYGQSIAIAVGGALSIVN